MGLNILQRRTRDENNKSVYELDEKGEAKQADKKKSVPLSDVWDIPYLNPKAKERVGYPTQKQLLLLERIIELSTHENDTVFDTLLWYCFKELNTMQFKAIKELMLFFRVGLFFHFILQPRSKHQLVKCAF